MPVSNTQRLDGVDQSLAEVREQLGSLEGRFDGLAEFIGRIVAEAVWWIRWPCGTGV